MTRELARLFRLFTRLEQRFGLSGLDPEERAIFDFIVTEIAAGRPATMNAILEAELASRANAYRKISNLLEAGLIEKRVAGTYQEYVLSRNLRGFKTSAKELARKIETSG